MNSKESSKQLGQQDLLLLAAMCGNKENLEMCLKGGANINFHNALCSLTLREQFTEIKIPSNSQTAVGILTLNWKSSNYINTITDIKESIGTPLRDGIQTTLSWIQGHANIAGN
ncbi:Hypothetical predicted protein [Mytilus galloprovincialis]|uniref:Uncharacterized protein n=1 Tax=Mytilus galloprovincialis TaxID=29158 RepID=A0A8B6FEC0_MYTGA|nr:Hypothetical predicted protein [Mytilus galloprovincialis]